jgi:hypothetical protein
MKMKWIVMTLYLLLKINTNKNGNLLFLHRISNFNTKIKGFEKSLFCLRLMEPAI